jgi:hypothetical protein
MFCQRIWNRRPQPAAILQLRRKGSVLRIAFRAEHKFIKLFAGVCVWPLSFSSPTVPLM